MASTISSQPRKSLSNTVWLLIEWYQHGGADVVNIKSVHASRDSATKAALVKVNNDITQDFMEDRIKPKIHVWKEGQNSSHIGKRDWWYMPDDQWMFPNFFGGYRLEKYDVIDEDKGFESTVWIQELRNDDPELMTNATIYDIDGIYGSESLALAARSTGVDERERYLGNRYILMHYQIQE